MNVLKKLYKKIVLALMTGIISSALQAQSILDAHLTDLRAESITRGDYTIKYRANAIENAKKLIESVCKNDDIGHDIEVDYLNNFSNMFLNTMAPSSMLGRISLSKMMQQSIHHRLSNNKAEEYAQQQALIECFKDLIPAIPGFEQKLAATLNVLDTTLCNVFIDGHTFGRWIKLVEEPQIARSWGSLGCTSLNIAGSLFGIPYLNSVILSTSPTAAAHPIITYGVATGLTKVLSSILIDRWHKEENAKLQTQQFNNNDVQAIMNRFMASIRGCTQIIEQVLLASQNPELLLLAHDLALPATIDPSWQSVRKITRVLNIIGLVDACFTLARTEIQGRLVPVQHNPELIAMPMTKNLLIQSLQELWNASEQDGHMPYQSDDNQLYILIQKAESLFFPNIILANTVGYILPTQSQLTKQLLIPLSWIMTCTQKVYMGTTKQESLKAITIPFSQMLADQ